MNIAVLGASFDPAHNGHLTIARNILRSQKANKVILMPVNIHPFAKKLTSPRHRLNMAKLLEEENIEVSDLEIKRGKISYTIDTLNELKKLYPKDHFVWIIGEDQIKNFTKWKDWREIINKFKLVIVPRTGFKKAGKELKNIAKLVSFPSHIILVNKNKFAPIYISSTLIRKKIKEKKSVSNMMPKKVEEYIIKHRLYL